MVCMEEFWRVLGTYTTILCMSEPKDKAERAVRPAGRTDESTHSSTYLS